MKRKRIEKKKVIHVSHCELKNTADNYDVEHKKYRVTFDQPKRIRDRIEQDLWNT